LSDRTNIRLSRWDEVSDSWSVGRVLRVGTVLLVLAVVAGSLAGQPLLLSYVETGSMEPTLDAGDGFVAVPPAVAGDVGPGDVVVYEAKQLNGGGLTTHRVVDETSNGYVTRGDANPFTDQDGSEPPVTDGQIRAVALQVGGSVVVLRGLGTAATGVQSVFETFQRALGGVLGTDLPMTAVGLLLLAVGLGLYGLETGDGRVRPERDRETGRTDPRLLVLVLTLVVVAPLTGAMVLPGGPQDVGIVSAESDSPAGHVVERGTTEERSYRLSNAGLLPTVIYLEPASEGVTVDPTRTVLDGGETRNATLAVSAPPETGYYVRSFVERRYVAVLPLPVLDGLYRTHPWAPVLVIDALVGGGFYLLGSVLVGSGTVRLRRRSREGARASWLGGLGRRFG
jgi:signal peptidase